MFLGRDIAPLEIRKGGKRYINKVLCYPDLTFLIPQLFPEEKVVQRSRDKNLSVLFEDGFGL